MYLGITLEIKRHLGGIIRSIVWYFVDDHLGSMKVKCQYIEFIGKLWNND